MCAISSKKGLNQPTLNPNHKTVFSAPPTAPLQAQYSTHVTIEPLVPKVAQEAPCMSIEGLWKLFFFFLFV
jgi:hypothetical protein